MAEPGNTVAWPGQPVSGGAWPGQPVARMPRQMRPVGVRLHDQNPEVRRQAEDEWNGSEHRPSLGVLETAADVGHSGVSGVQRGVAMTVGAPRDLADLWEGAVNAGAETLRKFLIEHGLDPASTANPEMRQQLDHDRQQRMITGDQPAAEDENLNGVGRFSWPSSAEINQRIEQVAGPQHQPQTQLGRYARTVGEFAPSALAPGGVGVRVARVVVPGVASEAAGQATEGTPAEPYARFAAALAGAGLSEGSIALLTRRGMTPDQRALRLIERELRNAGVDPDAITRAANKLTAQAPTEEIMAELMNPEGSGSPGLRLARATAAMGQGAGRPTAEAVLEGRATGVSAGKGARPVTSISDRVMREAARSFAPDAPHSPNSYWDMLDTLRASRAAQGAENYRNAYAQPIDQGLVQEHLAPLMREAPDAAKSAARQLDTETQRLLGQRSQLQMSGNADPEALAAIERDINDTKDAATQLRAIASGEPPNTINTRAIDYFQRGLQQIEQATGRGSPEAGAVGNFRRGFNSLADRIAPALGDTRSQYGRSMNIEDMTQLGRRVFEMSDGELERAMRGPSGRPLTTEEFDGFQLGVLDAIENKLGQGDTGFLARLARNKNWRDQLIRATGGEAEARRFMNRLAREASMQRTRNYVLKGSQTTPIAEDIKALTEGESELGFLNDHVRGFIASGGNLRNAALRAATWIWDRVHRPGIANPQVQEAMAKRLFARVTRDNAKELRDELLALRSDPGVNPVLRRWLNRVVAAESAVQESQHEREPAEAATP